MGKIIIEGYKCNDVDIFGVPRKYETKKKDQIICPKCEGPYWNIP